MLMQWLHNPYKPSDKSSVVPHQVQKDSDLCVGLGGVNLATAFRFSLLGYTPSWRCDEPNS